MEPGADVDILVVSAFHDDYVPTDSSLIGALHNKGISVEKLAENKAADLRSWCCCWMSRDIEGPLPPGLSFRRILCFEPDKRGEPPTLVEDLFRGLAPFLNDSQPSYTVTMPLVTTGNQMVPIPAMLAALVRNAYRWIKFGLPIRRLQIVERSMTKVRWLADEFSLVKKAIAQDAEGATAPVKKELRTIHHMISYAPQDAELRDELVRSLQSLRRQRIIDIWHEGLLLPNADIESEVARHLNEDDVVLLLVTPHFLESDRCMNQADLALERHRRHELRLIPILARPSMVSVTPFGSLAPLPTDGRPATEWPLQDQAWASIAGGIRLLVAA